MFHAYQVPCVPWVDQPWEYWFKQVGGSSTISLRYAEETLGLPDFPVPQNQLIISVIQYKLLLTLEQSM